MTDPDALEKVARQWRGTLKEYLIREAPRRGPQVRDEPSFDIEDASPVEVRDGVLVVACTADAAEHLQPFLPRVLDALRSYLVAGDSVNDIRIERVEPVTAALARRAFEAL